MWLWLALDHNTVNRFGRFLDEAHHKGEGKEEVVVGSAAMRALQEELRKIRRLCHRHFVEMRHIQHTLPAYLGVDAGPRNAFGNALAGSLKELDRKNIILMRDFPRFG